MFPRIFQQCPSEVVCAVCGGPLNQRLRDHELLYRLDIDGEETQDYYGDQHIPTEEEMEWLKQISVMGRYDFRKEMPTRPEDIDRGSQQPLSGLSVVGANWPCDQIVELDTQSGHWYMYARLPHDYLAFTAHKVCIEIMKITGSHRLEQGNVSLSQLDKPSTLEEFYDKICERYNNDHERSRREHLYHYGVCRIEWEQFQYRASWLSGGDEA